MTAPCNRVADFLHTTVCLVGVALLVVLIHIGTRTLPFGTLRKAQQILLRWRFHKTSGTSVENIARWIIYVERWLPGNRTCLTQALATETLLWWYGHSPKLYIGVDRDTTGGIEAHSWVQNEGEIIIGHVPGLQDYTSFQPLTLDVRL